MKYLLDIIILILLVAAIVIFVFFEPSNTVSLIVIALGIIIIGLTPYSFFGKNTFLK